MQKNGTGHEEPYIIPRERCGGLKVKRFNSEGEDGCIKGPPELLDQAREKGRKS